jgi:hypothetical protein
MLILTIPNLNTMVLSAPKHFLKLFSIFLSIIVALIINSCRKESNNATKTDLAPVIAQAKAWYENTYPQNTAKNSATTQTINSVANTVFDYSQHLQPDWRHPANYVRFSDNVIEMPIDPASTIYTALSNSPGAKAVYQQQYSRSSFLLLNNGQNYQAYIMTIIADPGYLKMTSPN